MTVTMFKMIGNDHGESDDCGDDYGYGDESDDDYGDRDDGGHECSEDNDGGDDCGDSAGASGNNCGDYSYDVQMTMVNW